MSDTLNDCFKSPGALLRLDDALDMLAARLFPVVDTEDLPLTKAAGRILAAPVCATVANPRFDNAAMDGFCARAADLNADGPTSLAAVGRIAAGSAAEEPIAQGTAARIFTGAPLPPGADVVAMQEDCTAHPSLDAPQTVTFPAGLSVGNFVRRAGDDFSTGATVLSPGRRLRPQDVAMAAAAGHATVTVFKRLKAGVLSTGDEIVEPGHPLGPAQIYGSNRYGLMAALAALGAEVTDLGHLPDRRDATEAALAAAGRSQDVIVTSGGVSVGGEDHVVDAVRALGEVHVWRMAVKPGKPTTLGTVGRAAFIGLPGYPVSSLATFMMVARPVVLRLSGALAEPLFPGAFPLPAGFSFAKKHRRRQFVRASIDRAGGTPVVRLYPSQEPHVLSSMIASDGLVDLREDCTGVAEGDMVDFIPYSSILPA
ncbi:Molybdopterin biosynthesis protein MoeA [Caenispirillum salinarum AK4]|uniref:Molybdopterin molybdenumtransferase n=1 Tax=Caenispirillum salinarum AK4 TaxID=1238182 RepID=K9HGC1_9PROT|nr:gephyrin-like molybdotransferase Glp [Caenispirillum salinarum]EKV29513.1 Molybdopterin biosynthesis protein MoeA [Caenispirillum salinarum AK4]